MEEDEPNEMALVPNCLTYNYFILRIVGGLIVASVKKEGCNVSGIGKYLQDGRFYFATSFILDFTESGITESLLEYHPDKNMKENWSLSNWNFVTMRKSLEFVRNEIMYQEDSEELIERYKGIVMRYISKLIEGKECLREMGELMRFKRKRKLEKKQREWEEVENFEERRRKEGVKICKNEKDLKLIISD